MCKGVTSEPVLLPVTGETFVKKSINTSDKARFNIKERGYWVKGLNALFEIRVFGHSALRYFNQSLPKSYSSNEKEEKGHYNDRVLEVENCSFSPIVLLQ